VICASGEKRLDGGGRRRAAALWPDASGDAERPHAVMSDAMARTAIREAIMVWRIYGQIRRPRPAPAAHSRIDILYEPRIFVQNVDRKPP
jgi:hypothetical protein